MTRIRLLILSVLFPIHIMAQVVTSSPVLPIDNQPDTITFDATMGNAGLKGYTGDVYAHTGVVTNLSTKDSLWRYVKAAWTTNLAACKLKRIATDKYQLYISPSIRQFYSVPDAEKILQMAFVFRSSNGNTTGRDVGDADIFTKVFEQGLNVSFNSPSVKFSLVDKNQKIPISISASDNDSIWLFLDQVKIKSVAGQSLIDTLSATGSNLHSLVAMAVKGNNTVADTVTYLVNGITQNATLPAGVHDGINYMNDTTVTFVLFAPYKKFVYLIGDFNNWTPDSSNLMYRGNNSDTARFWITMNNLVKGKEYVFQYLIDGSIRIADPYCEKISDPWNDQYIPASTYPDLITYPNGKTTGIAGVIQTAHTPYNWQVTDFVKPDKNKLVVYELLIRDFTSKGNIKTVTDTLAYLKRLGVNAIELMPFSEFDGNDSWGYNPCFYFAPDKAYGTREDYKKFIDTCHASGIAVIQDMVLDFSTNNSPLVQMYLSNGKPTAQNPWYNVNAPSGAYTFGGFDFNHESIYTKKLTDSITSFWMNEYKIDGFRFDFAKGWTNTAGEGTPYDQQRINNLELAADHIWKQNPKAYVILELFTDNSEEKVLANYGMMIWGNMNYAYGQASMSNSNGWNFSGISYKNLGWDNPCLVGYMESHDEEREMYRNVTYGNAGGTYNIKDTTTALKRMELDNTFFLTVPGPKMIWQFGEVGYDIRIDSMGRVGDKPIKWGYYNDSRRRNLYNVTKALIKLKQEEPVFSTTNFTLETANALKHIELTGKDTIVEIIGNFDVYGNGYTLTFPATGQWFEFFTGDTLTLTNKVHNFDLNPGEYRLYTNKRITPYNGVGTKIAVSNAVPDLKIYPNPAYDLLSVSCSQRVQVLNISDLSGKTIRTFTNLPSGNNTIHLEGIHSGIYFMKFQIKGDFITRKFVIQ